MSTEHDPKKNSFAGNPIGIGIGAGIWDTVHLAVLKTKHVCMQVNIKVDGVGVTEHITRELAPVRSTRQLSVGLRLSTSDTHA